MQAHFKLLLVREVKTAETEFARTGSEQLAVESPLTPSPHIELSAGVVQS